MTKQKNKSYGILIIAGLVAVAFIGIIALGKSGNEPGSSNSLTPADSFSHAHGMAVDVEDTSKLYIATHNGLFLLENDKDLYKIGDSQDDLMGFSAHPTDPRTFFSSGHPKFGGNLGFQKSEDGGQTWQKISDGSSGPVDFHAMAVGQVNPDIIYGSYGGLQRSLDGGENWEAMPGDLPDIIYLSTDTKEENTVYAATSEGLHFSTDSGGSWEALSGIGAGPVFTVAVNPDNNQELIAYAQERNLVRSSDGGRAWKAVDIELETSIMYLAYARSEPSVVYAIDRDNNIFKSTDSGQVWEKQTLK